MNELAAHKDVLDNYTRAFALIAGIIGTTLLYGHGFNEPPPISALLPFIVLSFVFAFFFDNSNKIQIERLISQ